MALPVETFFLHPDAQGTLQQQIQQMIAQGILTGRFGTGEKLPSTRKLAAHLGISRITVTIAYTELLANDYLTSRGRSGYYVSENAPAPPQFTPAENTPDAVDWTRAIGQRFSGGVTPIKHRTGPAIGIRSSTGRRTRHYSIMPTGGFVRFRPWGSATLRR